MHPIETCFSKQFFVVEVVLLFFMAAKLIGLYVDIQFLKKKRIIFWAIFGTVGTFERIYIYTVDIYTVDIYIYIYIL